MFEGVRISRSQLSKALRKKLSLATPPAHAEGTPNGKRGGTGGPAPQTAQTAGRSGRHCSSHGDESEALTHPYLAPRLGELGGGLACSGARAGQEGRDHGVARSSHPPTHHSHQPDQAQQRFYRPSGATRPPLRTAARAAGQAGRAGRGQMAPSTPANARSQPSPLAPTGSKSSGCRNTLPNSTTSSRSGATSRPIISPTRPSPTRPLSTTQSITLSSISTASAAAIRWPNRCFR